MSDYTGVDYEHMARALRLARRGLYTAEPNPCVGCVLVRDGQVVGEGWHRRAGEPHAEANALAAAGALAHGATAYVTLEPCSHHGRTPPCADALAAAGVQRVIAAVTDPNTQVAGHGLQRLQQAGVVASSGLLEAQASALNRGYMRRMRNGRPWVRLKLASSLDGRTAMASGESRWITGPAARRDVHRQRASSGAILTGIGTVLADDPRLTARDIATELAQPRRYVLDSRLRLPATAAMVVDGGGVSALCATPPPNAAALQAVGVVVQPLPAGPDGRVSLAAAIERIGADGVNELLVEAGSTLAGALLQQGIVDELVVYLAPHLMGAAARPLAMLNIADMQERLALRVTDTRHVGDDLRVTLAPSSDHGAADAEARPPQSQE